MTIEHLDLKFVGAAGHMHRVRPITRRALELLQLLWRDELLVAGAGLDDLRVAHLTVSALPVDLTMMSDEAVAEKLAEAMYSALRARWQEG